MNKLLSVVLTVGMASICLLAEEPNTTAKIAGEWQMSVETPHGTMTGPLNVEQDGTKITGSYETEHAGKLTITGKVDGKKVTFSMDARGMTVTFAGTVDGDKMSGTADPMGGWSATRK